MIDFSLTDKVALITGASRGIGEAIAQTLAEHGAHCIVVSRKLDALQSVVDKIKRGGGSAEAMACHIGQLDQIKNLFQVVSEKHGKLDILVNNAVTNPFFGEMVNVDEGVWNKTLEVNLKGPFFMIKYASQLMEKSGSGSIVNVSSISGIKPGLWQGVYSITKAGVISMTKAYAKELGAKKIRVNALLPGLTKTKFAGALFEDENIYKLAIQGTPLGRHAEPIEMAGAVLYLVSAAASFTTGICLICDGGVLA